MPNPNLTRRQLVTSAATFAVGGLLAAPSSTVVAQTPEATPVAPERATQPAESQPRRGGEARVVRPGMRVTNFNPAAFAQDQQIPISYLEPLVRADPITMAPRPWLAEHWTWHDNGTRLILTLRDGIAWHDGRALTADDAVFTYLVYRDDADSVVAGLFALVESVEATSARDVTIQFLERDPNWLLNAATLPIVSRQQYETFWNEQRSLSTFDWKRSTPIGTGPWQVASWDEQRVRFTRFDTYWGESPWLDALEVAVAAGAHDRLERWQDGTARLLWPAPTMARDEAKTLGGRIVAAPAASVMFAAFNFANPNQPNGSLWTDLRVRRAAAMAIDRARYAEEVFAGFIEADAVGTVAQPWAHDDTLEAAPFNREAAAVLLADAGWVDYDGDGIREDAGGVQLRPVAILREDSQRALADVMARVARDLFEVGFGLTLEVLSPEEFEDRWIARRDYDLVGYAYDQLPGFTDFDLYGSAWDIRANPAGWNPGGYRNADADAAIEEFLAAVSLERQRAALHRLQQAVNDDLFGLWLGFPNDVVLLSQDLQGFEPDIAWQTAQTAKLWLSPGSR